MAIGSLKSIGKRVGGAARGAGRGMSGMGDNKMMPIAMAGVAAAGLVGSSAGSFVDLGNEAAFGNENADQAFLGSRGLSPGTVFDSMLGDGMATTGTLAGAGIGAAAGGMAGMAASKVWTDALQDTNIHKSISGKVMPPLINAGESTGKFADNIPLIGGKNIPKSLIKPGAHSPKVRGLGAVGAIAGAVIGGSAYMSSYINRNRDFMQSNPYNRGSAAQASSTNAYGDIVLGMHNSRRG